MFETDFSKVEVGIFSAWVLLHPSAGRASKSKLKWWKYTKPLEEIGIVSLNSLKCLKISEDDLEMLHKAILMPISLI